MDKDKTIPTLSQTTVMPCAISDDDLKLAYGKIQLDFEPIQADFDIVRAKFESDKKQMNDSFAIILEKYYDERFLDKESVSIKIGDTITDGKNSYSVSDRGMQMIFGTMIFNNRITCKKLDKDLKIGKKDFSFSVRELADFVVHKA
jgi:hypothetical protein